MEAAVASRTSRERRRSAPVPPRSAPRTARARREPARRTTAAASWCEVRAGSPGPGPPPPFSVSPTAAGTWSPPAGSPLLAPGPGGSGMGHRSPQSPSRRRRRRPGTAPGASPAAPGLRAPASRSPGLLPAPPPRFFAVALRAAGPGPGSPQPAQAVRFPGAGPGWPCVPASVCGRRAGARPGAAGRAGGPGEQRRGHGTIPPAAPRPPPGRPSPAGGTRRQRERGESISSAFKALSQEKSVMERRRVRGYLVVVWCLLLVLGFFLPLFIISLARPGLGGGGSGYAAGPARGTAGPGASGCDRVQPTAGPGARWDQRVFYGKPRKVRGGGESRRGCGRRGGAERSPGRGAGGGGAAPSRGRAWGCSAGVSPPPRPPNRSPEKLRGCPASSPAFGQARAVGTGASAPARPCRPCPLPRGRRGPIPVPARSPRAGPGTVRARLGHPGSPGGCGAIAGRVAKMPPAAGPSLFPGCRDRRLSPTAQPSQPEPFPGHLGGGTGSAGQRYPRDCPRVLLGGRRGRSPRRGQAGVRPLLRPASVLPGPPRRSRGWERDWGGGVGFSIPNPGPGSPLLPAPGTLARRRPVSPSCRSRHGADKMVAGRNGGNKRERNRNRAGGGDTGRCGGWGGEPVCGATGPPGSQPSPGRGPAPREGAGAKRASRLVSLQSGGGGGFKF